MKVFLLPLVLIGFCFDINSGCCCKKRDKGNGGGGSGNLGSKKSVPGGGPGKPTPSETDKFDTEIIVRPDGVTIKPVNSTSIELKEAAQVSVEDKKIVSNYYYTSTKAYKFDYSKMIMNANVTVDNEIKKKPYLIAMLSLKGDESSKYIVIVSNEDGDMSSLFYSLNITGVSLLSSNGITDMTSMFSMCAGLSVCNINIDTSKVTKMGCMFYGCKKLETLDLSCFNTSKVTKMGSMFYGCEKLETLDLSCFNTSEVDDMRSMFFLCKKLKNINFGNNFKSDKIPSLSYMFYGCTVLSKLDFKNFDISKIAREQRREMFKNCNSLNEVVFCMVNKDLADDFSSIGFTSVDNKTWKKSTK